VAWDNSDRRARLPKDWHTRRQRVLRRDGYRCKVLKEGRRCTNPARDVDHVVRGDDHSESNLRAICVGCHKAKSSAEGVAAQPRRKRPPEAHPGLLPTPKEPA
jgi:5-methylcytosine-specific restriction endonuclease McrA